MLFVISCTKNLYIRLMFLFRIGTKVSLYSSYKLLKPLIRIRCSEFVDIRWKLEDSGQVRFPDLI